MWLALAIVLPILAIEYALHSAKNVRDWEDAHKGQADYLPFRRKDLKLWSRPRLYVGAVLFLGLRIIIILLAVVLEWIALKLIFRGVNLSIQPLPKSKSEACRKVTRVLTRMLLFGFGYWYIEEKGKPSRQAPMIVSNHVTFTDIVYLMTSDTSPSFVSKSSIQDWPCIGLIATSLQCVFVDRNEGREAALEAIRSRQQAVANGVVFPQLAIFPEGTTTNGNMLIQFSKGSFINKLPVQPVFLHYPHSHVSPALDCLPMWTLLVLLCSQFYNRLQVTWLPVSEGGDLTAMEFANKVQSEIAHVKGIPMSHATFKEKFSFLERIRGSKQKV